MENRFSIKDFFLFLLLAGLIVVVVLAMAQFDRQFEEVQTIKRQNSELTGDVARLRTSIGGLADTLDDLRSRPFVAGPGDGATQPSKVQPMPTKNAFSALKQAEQEPNFARGDWMIDNFGTKLGKLTPLVGGDVYQAWVESQVLESMAVRDPETLDYVPRLASRWEVSEDGLTMKFTLRQGVTFSDGTPLTADDVVFTFDWIRNPAVNADRQRAYLTDLKDVKKLDDRTVEFTFNKYYYQNFDVAGGMPIMSKHFYSKYTPDEFNEKTGLLMGSGPYRLENPESWTPGTLVQLVRNERYWGTPPTFDRIVFNEIQGEGPEARMYGNQNLDVIRPQPEQYRILTGDPRIMAFSNAMEYDNMYGGYNYIAWNQRKITDGQGSTTRFADKRVRQAMTLLLDRERILKEIYLGYGNVASGPFSPKGKQYNQSIKPWPHDEAKAKALLAEAGFADRNNDGLIEGPDGKPFRFTLTYPSGNETIEKIVLFMKDSFARAGIVMEPERVDWPVLVQKLNQSNFEAVTLAWSSSPESDPYQVFHSSQIAGQGDNRTNYINKELDALIEEARRTVDEDKRMEIWRKAHAILHEDQPYTFLFNRKALRLFNDRIENIKPATIGLNFEYMNGGMIPWYVPKGEQKYTQ